MIRKTSLLTVVAAGSLLLGATGLAAEPASEAQLLSLPDTPAWQLGRGFVAAFNAGDGEALSRYFAKHLSERAAQQQPALWRAAELQRQRRELGAVEVREASGVSHVLVLNARAGSGEDVDVVVVVSVEDPTRIDELRLVRQAGSDLALGGAR
jgi:hypothetical protein